MGNIQNMHETLNKCLSLPLRLLSHLKKLSNVAKYAIGSIIEKDKQPQLRVLSTYNKDQRIWVEIQVCGTRTTFTLPLSDLALRKRLLMLFDIDQVSYLIWTTKEEHDIILAEKIEAQKKRRLNDKQK